VAVRLALNSREFNESRASEGYFFRRSFRL
jgi:hypothetical protein